MAFLLSYGLSRGFQRLRWGIFLALKQSFYWATFSAGSATAKGVKV
ncbi:unnamed protein product, partial [marine sediment metagenome]